MGTQSSRGGEVPNILSQTIEAISEQFRNPLALLCGLAFAGVIFTFEYYAFVRDRERARNLTQKRSRKAQEIHIDFSSEESVEEEQEEKARIHIPLATGVVGLVAQSLNLAAGKSFVAIEIVHLAQTLQGILQRLTRAQAQGSAAAVASEERQQLIQELQNLHRNITEISANLNPAQSGLLNLNLSANASGIVSPTLRPSIAASAISASAGARSLFL